MNERPRNDEIVDGDRLSRPDRQSGTRPRPSTPDAASLRLRAIITFQASSFTQHRTAARTSITESAVAVGLLRERRGFGEAMQVMSPFYAPIISLWSRSTAQEGTSKINALVLQRHGAQRARDTRHDWTAPPKKPSNKRDLILDLHNKPHNLKLSWLDAKAREMAVQWSRLRCRNYEGNSREPRITPSAAYLLVIINIAFHVSRDEAFRRRQLKY